MAESPLTGKRILILRAAHQADATAAAVRARGAEPVLFPVIEITEPGDPEAVIRAVGAIDSYDWVVFTSANGVDRCFAAIDEAGGAFLPRRVAAIGPKTAEAARAHDCRVDLVASKYVAEELAQDLLARGTPGRVLLLRALSAREVLPELLRAAGSEVDVVPVYETRQVSIERAPALRDCITSGAVDAVLFTASSTVTAVADLLGPLAAEQLARVIVASIGPVTSGTLRECGIRTDVTAAEHTLSGLLDALELRFAGAVAG